MTPFKHISRGLLFSGLLCGAAACFPSADAAEPTAEARPSQPLISTTGSGEVSVRPDAFRLSLGVEARAETLQKARDQVNTGMQRILQKLKSLSIPGLSLRTEILQISPVYAARTAPPPNIGPEGTPVPPSNHGSEALATPPKIIGYEVRNGVSVAVIGGAPDKLGDYASTIIDAGIQSGANRVGNVSFFLHDQKAAQDSALDAAVKDATRKAQAIASASGVRIVRIQTVEEGFGFGAPMQGGAALSVAAEAAPTPVESGNIVLGASVTARFVFAK